MAGKKIAFSCLGCLGSIGMAGLVGMFFLLLLSKFAFDFLSSVLLGGLDLIRQIIVGLIGLIGALSPVVALGLGLALLVFFVWLVQTRRQSNHWRMLESIRREWVPLQKLLRARNLRTYERELEQVRVRLFAERDRIEAIDNLCSEELPLVQNRLEELSKLEGLTSSPREKAELRDLMKDLAANSGRLAGKKHLRSQFDAAKIRLAAKLQTLRLRLADVSHDPSAMQSILAGVDSVSFLHDVFDSGKVPGDVTEGRGTVGLPSEDGEADADRPVMRPQRGTER